MVKLNGYICFSIVLKDDTFQSLELVSLYEESSLKWDLFLKERICS